MAVTKAQISNWSKAYDEKQRTAANGTAAAGKTTGEKTTAAPLAARAEGGTQRVSRSQIAQWSQEYSAKQKKQAEDQSLYATALEDYRAKNNLGFADAMDTRNDSLNPDVYAVVNNWKDGSEYNRNLANLVTKEYPVKQPDTVDGVDWNGTGVGAAPYQTRKLTDEEIMQQGYSKDEVSRARSYMEAYDRLSLLEKAKRRVGNSALGTLANFAGGTAMMLGNLPQGVGTEVKDEDRMRTLMRAVQRVDGTNGAYTDADLIRNGGWTQDEIKEARARLAAGEASNVVDNPVYNWGRDTHKKGEELMADAQAGESDFARFWHGAATSTAENLVLGAINPALILPVLSAQGAGDSMAASDEKGDSPEKALAKSALKFGAGWAINSVGAADLAKTMGSSYAKDTLAGQIADWVQGLVGDTGLAKTHPAVAAALSGGIDNAMQAFVETYADQAIDAALGDEEAARTMFSKDTFLTALESGLSGGASGALGGAVGKGLARMNGGDASWRGQAERAAAEVDAEKAAAGDPPHQSAAQTAGLPLSLTRHLPPAGGSLSSGEAFASAGKAAADGVSSSIVDETAVNDDPAVHTAAQNAGIEQYKNSVDPKMAEYVDKVRAGEKLEPYVVTRTSDRMRSAMMELTGLEKVGDYTLLDNNGVNHITNRHAGGDGSADATMKNSADVARAAYVLNNYDNAYLGTRKADGYYTSNRKKAPIVIFEKKIDGSHIIVEAVCDTKKSTNYIVSEYLSKNGVDEKEIAKRLQPSMDVASDPRDTSETLSAAHSATAEVLRSPMNAVADPEAHVRNVVADPSAISASMPQSPMDAVADPRDTSKTLAEDYDAIASIAPGGASVNGNGVENGAERVESTTADGMPSQLPVSGMPSQLPVSGMPSQSAQSGVDTVRTPHQSAAQTASPQGEAFASAGAAAAESYADLELKPDAEQLDTADWNRDEQRAAARQLVNRAQMTTKAAQAVVDAMPQGVGATVYSQAVNSLYRMGVTQDVKSFEQAVNLTGGMNSLGGAVRQVLALGDVGENALRIAYTYGKGEAEAYNARKAAEIGSGKGAVNPDAGTYFKGRSVSKGGNALDAFIELGAKSSGTAIHRAVEGLKNGAKGYIRAAAGEMYLSGEAGSETVMHETFHALNEWSRETGQAVMDRLLTYLVQQNGMESTEKLVESYLARYEAAGQRVTWNQALEEITADAMETVFGTEEAFRDFVRQQAAEARMNASARGMIGKVMDHIKNLLDTVLADVNRFLKKEPTNAAAKAAKSLTEAQLKDLQALYFEHQAEAGAKYREAVETAKSGTETKNTAPSEAEDAAVKYSLPEMASETDEEKTKRQEALTIRPAQVNPERTARVSETDWSERKTQDVYKAIRTILNEFGVTAKTFRMEDVDVEFSYGSNNIQESANKQSILTKDEYNDFALVQANIEEVLAHAVPLEAHADKKGKAHVDGMIVLASALQDGERIIPVRAELKLYDNRPTALYMAIAETTAEESWNAANKKRTGSQAYDDAISHTMEMPTGSSENPDRQVRQEPLLTQEAALPGSSDLTITDFYDLVKHDANFTKYFSDEVAYKAEQVEELQRDPARSDELEEAQERLKARARAIEKDRSYLKDSPEKFLTQDEDGKYQLDVDSDAAEATRTAALGDVDRQTELVGQVVELGGKVRLSDQSITDIVRAVLSDTNSRMSAKTLTERLRALNDYLALTKNVSWEDANAFMTDIAEQIMLKSSKKNDELWRQYPELHQMSMTIEKGSADYKEILYHWGSWADARKELARHGVKITQSKEGVHSRWDADFTELQKLGAGLLPTETPNSAVDALEAMASAHDNIRPVMENAYDEDWNGAKQDIAMQLWQRYMNSPEVANEQNAEARKEFAQQWEEVRKQARQEALEARAKAFIDQAKFAQELKAAKDAAASARKETEEAESRADLAGIQAKDKADLAQAFAEKQRDSVSAAIQLAKDRAAKQLQKARDAREMDTTRRNVRKMTSQLTQMLEKPTEKSHVTDYMMDMVRPVAALANDAIGNHKAADRLRAEINGTYGPLPAAKSAEDALEGLQRGIAKEMSMTERAAAEWNRSGITERISELLNDLEETRAVEMEKLRGEIANAEQWLTEDTPEKKAYLARLHSDLKAYQDGNLSTLTADQMRDWSSILEQTLFLVKNENVMLGSIEDVMIDDFAEGVAGELADVRKKQKDNLFGKIFREVTSVYRLNTMNIERNFERLGGYHHGGFLEQLGQQLNQGQSRKERITAEGERIFANVTGPKNAEKLYHFTHDLVDIGLKTQDGKPWLVTHDVMAELWVQLQNKQGLHHLLYGGATIADMSLSTKGFAGLGEQYAETVTLGELVTTDKDGSKLNAYEISRREDALRTSLIGEIEKNLTEYDEQWIADFRELGKLTKGYVNETSMALFGTKIARVENYIRLHVDRNTLVEQNEGVKMDASVTNAGFTKNRQVSAKPLELVGLVRQASESIENTAQYAGMAIPLRNAEKVLNTMEGGNTLYGAIERSWGRAGRKYMTKAMADLTGSKGESEVFDHLSGALRGAAAAAVLTGNLNVTLLQAASLPTAAAELGWGSTGASALQFVMNLKPSELNGIVERAYRFGDSLLPTRLRGSSRGELSTAAKEQGVGSVLHDGARNSKNAVLRYGTRAVDALADVAGGSIGWMDKVTVASLFHGAENYVQKNLAEYDLTKADLPTKALEDGSKAYQNAVMSKFQRVVERTQPNYTVMQRTGMQRSKNQMLKTVTMFSTQRQQNAQIMVSAVEDLAAQVSRNSQAKAALEKAKAENDAPRLAECKAAAEKAKADQAEALKRFGDAVSSQIVQTAVIAGLGVLVKFLLHRWDDLQDENGDMTVASLGGSLLYQFGNSMVSNYTGGSELWTAAETIHSKRMFGNYDSVSMTGFSAINDAVTSITKLNALLDKDTSEMDEEELNAYADQVKRAWADAAGQLMMLKGVPYNNGKKYVQAVFAWIDTAKQWEETGEVNFNSTPDSATGQYDRLFEAIQTGNTEEVQAATKKLERMLAEGKIKELKTGNQLKARLKKYDEDILDAAKAKNAGDLEARKDAKQEVYDRLCAAYGVKKLGEKGETDEDKARRARFRELIDQAVDEKAEQLYKGGTSGSVYDALTEAVDTGRADDVQDEVKRLRTAGKDDGQIRSKITDAVKEEYLAGNGHDREQLEQMLLKLKKADGTPMYENKNFVQWVRDAEKKEESAKNEKDEWAGVR